MSTTVGLGTVLAFAEQAAEGVADAPTHWLPVVALDLDAEYTREPVEHTGHPGQDVDEYREMFLASIMAKGSVTVLPGYNDASLLLYKHMLGAVAETGSGPYTRTYTPYAGIPDGTAGLTLAPRYGTRGPSNRKRALDTAAVSKWELSWKAGERGRLKVDFVGRNITPMQAAGTAPTLAATPPIAAYQHLLNAGFSVGGTKVEGLESVKISCDRKIASPKLMGSLYPDTPEQEGALDVMIDLEFRWKDNLLLELYESGAYFSGSVGFSDGTHQLGFTFPRCQVVGHPITVSGRGFVRVACSVRALGTSAAPSITMTSVSDRETL